MSTKKQGRANKAPTKIEDIALEAGVSIMTVSRAIRGVEGVSDRKRQEILRLAKRRGYVPNRNAQSLAVANSNLIGISVPTLIDQVYTDIFEGMRNILESAGYEAVFEISQYDPLREESWLKRMMQWQPVGLVVTGSDRTATSAQNIRQSGIPTIEIWDYNPKPIDCCVGIDHWQAGVDAANYLISRGYRKPAVAGALEGSDKRSEARFNGFASVFFDQFGIETKRYRSNIPSSFDAGRKLMQQIAADMDKPDCCFFLNDHSAFGAVCHSRNTDLKVPEDIGIMGFNGLDLNDVLNQKITTVKTPLQLMGTTAMRNLIARIHGADIERAISMPVTIEIGTTTR